MMRDPENFTVALIPSHTSAGEKWKDGAYVHLTTVRKSAYPRLITVISRVCIVLNVVSGKCFF